MKITTSKLHTLLIAGESAAIEYKRCGEGAKADTFESICAFLNKTGGDVILGVEDDGTITPENLEPMSKNPIIANFFHQIGLADELGSGVRNLYRFTKLYSGGTPLFEEDDIFRIAVPLVGAAKNATLNEAVHVATNDALNDTLSDTLNDALNSVSPQSGKGDLRMTPFEAAMVRLLRKNCDLTLVELAEKMRVPRLRVARNMKRLQECHVIVREGSKKTGQWKLNFSPEKGVADNNNTDVMSGKMSGKEELQERVESALKDSSERVKENVVSLLDYLQAHPSAKIADLVERFQMVERSVSRYLRLARERGLVKRVGADKGGHWEVCRS